ncbi:MAG: malic enzyme-like NAD(P)-binding protein [Candidatus Gracilibacteria bacterium]|jgi:malate dehydrogenase (oxaloacetate-decarboxylating)(NADP+)
MTAITNEEVLDYHRNPVPGKIATKPTKACESARDLSMAYTPGVALPSLEIYKNKDAVFDYTGKGNSVAVVSDGTAVLGLGEVGPEAALPVMEGKVVLLKRFADINGTPLCLGGKIDHNEARQNELISAIKLLEPTFGAIILEDIKAPLCFDLQKKLDAEMDIPVFHDDQEGTSIVITAGILNALEAVGKKIDAVKIVFSGAGAAGISCANLLLDMGADLQKVYLCDSKGLITEAREDLNSQKRKFAKVSEAKSLGETVQGADIFIGVSRAGLLSKEVAKTMNPDAIVFAVANPTPEIMPEDAIEAGVKVIGTGRSDYPNQVNNSLGFPGIFRGALDTRCRSVNQAMKLAAAKALASLVKKTPPDEVRAILESAYPEEAQKGHFQAKEGIIPGYIIPKQFDIRVVPTVARAVAEAAMQSGMARLMIPDLDAYEKSVYERIAKI